jgi:hypothetical protein
MIAAFLANVDPPNATALIVAALVVVFMLRSGRRR